MVWIDKFMGETDKGLEFGYVGEARSMPNAGGYFFEWHPTLQKTLASIEPDIESHPKKLGMRTVERMVRTAWRAQQRKAKRATKY